MGVVSEKLQIVDGFSSTFTNFNALGERVANTLDHISARLDETAEKQAEAGKKTEEHGIKAKKATGSFEALEKAAFRLGAALGSIMSVKALIGLSDQLSQTRTRLEAIKGEFADVGALQEQIFNAAQRSRGSYMDMASSVAALKAQTGDVFTSTAEAVRFTELLNKQFALSGTSASSVASTMYNLTQALATGVLRGNDLQMVMANSPALIKLIAEEMGEPIGKIKELASEGKVTADIVKAAIMGAGADIDAQFNEMPMTFGQAMQKVKNVAIRAFEPIGQMIANAIKSPEFQTAINVVANGIYGLVNFAGKGFQLLGRTIGWVRDNLSWIAPVLGVVTAAVIAYNIATGIGAAVSFVSSAAEAVRGAAMAFAAGKTFAATVAQYGLNAAIAACPVTWIVLAVIAIIAAVIGAIVALHNFAQTGHTVFGDVAGVAVGAFTVIKNWAAIIANAFISAVEWLVNAWNKGIYTVKLAIFNFVKNSAERLNAIIDAADTAATALANAFISGANMAIGGINKLIDAINAIPGVDIGHVEELGGVESIISTRINPDAMVAPEAPGQVSFGRFATTTTGEAWSAGFEKGAAAGDAAQGKLTGILDNVKGLFSGFSDSGLMDGGDISALGDFAADAAAGGADVGKVGSVGSVKSVENVKLSDEDMKIYRDLAERRYMNQIELKTLAPNISVSIPESAAGNLSAEDVADRLKLMLIEQMAAGTAVAH
ncbi:MAG: tape measure protein [Oscillospiraceae bacterium]|nr:tape measure protein [Oscillospiraceae bacterium]